MRQNRDGLAVKAQKTGRRNPRSDGRLRISTLSIALYFR